MRSGPKRAHNGANHVHDFVKLSRISPRPSSPLVAPAIRQRSPRGAAGHITKCEAARMKAMQQNETKREAHLRELASRLLFSMENEGARFRLYRDADVRSEERRVGKG